MFALSLGKRRREIMNWTLNGWKREREREREKGRVSRISGSEAHDVKVLVSSCECESRGFSPGLTKFFVKEYTYNERHYHYSPIRKQNHSRRRPSLFTSFSYLVLSSTQ